MKYSESGVDIELADRFVDRLKTMVGRTYNDRVMEGIGGFCALYKMDEERILASATDGVGTKLKLAFELNQHDTIGLDLVAMCANDLICCGARPLFFLDYFATGKLRLETSEAVLSGIVRGCEQAGMALIGGETAEMPGMYGPGEYDLAGFAVGEVFRNRRIDGKGLQGQESLVAIGSSGLHSNGFSLVRKLIEEFPENRRRELSIQCLTPTKIYVSLVNELLKRNLVLGLAHITGSGVLNIPRMNESLGYEIQQWPDWQPEWMKEIVAKGGNSTIENFTTFNMGVGLVVATRNPTELIELAESKGERAKLIGTTTREFNGLRLFGELLSE